MCGPSLLIMCMFLHYLVCILFIQSIVPYVLGYLLAIPTLFVGVTPLRFAYLGVPLGIVLPSDEDLATIYSSARCSYYYFCKN